MKVVDGIHYAHHFPSGIMGSAISGENIGRTLLTKHKVSATVGHSHLLDYAISTLPNGKKLHGLSAGCYYLMMNILQEIHSICGGVV